MDQEMESTHKITGLRDVIKVCMNVAELQDDTMGKKEHQVDLFVKYRLSKYPQRPVRFFCLGILVVILICACSVVWLCFVFSGQLNDLLHGNCKTGDGVQGPSDDRSHGDNVPDRDRFDCWPEHYDGKKQTCEARGCTFDSEVTPGTPWCYYPKNFDRVYLMYSSQKTGSGVIGHLQRTSKSPYPDDVMALQLEISVETNSRLHMKIYDPSKHRYEVPISLNKNAVKDPVGDFDIELSREPFSVTIKRKSTGKILFDSSDVAPLMFADQFLQFGTKLTSPDIYGLGEHRSSLKLHLNRTKIVFWNRDQPPEQNLNLYGSHPFFLNLDDQNNAHGVFLLNSNAMQFDLQMYKNTGALTFRSLGGILDFYIFLGPTPDEVVEQYVSLVGKPLLPPLWSLGFQLCKYGYESGDELKTVIKRNRAAKMPYDVQWNDIDYMRSYLDWTYDHTAYAGLKDIVDDLTKHNQHYVIIVDPGISNTQSEGSYPPYDDGVKDNIFVKDYQGGNLVGKVWPGTTVFPDYFHPHTEEWLYNQAKSFRSTLKFSGLWLDMNEPSDFVNGSLSGCSGNKLDNPPFIPPTIGGSNLISKTICPSAMQNISSHYNLHNLYGYSEMKVTSSVTRRLWDKRMLITSRSTYPGAGQYGGHWLGDNVSEWSDMFYSIPGILSFQMFGIPLVGADVCGFQQDTNTELCTRWMQLGAFYPFMRNHNSGQKDQDPASFDTETQDIMRSVLKIRYQLLPFLYTLMYRSHVSGTAVARPLFFQYPNIPTIDRQFLWGSDLLISPVLDEGATMVEAYIPNDVWYDFYNRSRVVTVGRQVALDAPIDKIVLHIRGGSIIPTKPPVVTTRQLNKKAFCLWVALDDKNQASGEVFYDDGIALDTVENGIYSFVTFSVKNNVLSNTVVKAGYKGSGSRLDSFIIMGVTPKPKKVTVNGEKTPFSYDGDSKVLSVSGFSSVSLLQPLKITW